MELPYANKTQPIRVLHTGSRVRGTYSPSLQGGGALTLPHLARAFPQHVFRLGLSRYGADLELLTIDTFRCLCTTDSPHEVLIKLHLIIVGTGGRIKDEPP